MERMRKLMGTIVMAMVMLMLAACGPELPDAGGDNDDYVAASEMSAGDKDALVIGLKNAPASRNPFFISGASEKWAARFMYETILDMTGPTDFQPRLGDIATEDNQVFTITFKEGVTWTDGEPVTAEDFVYTVNTIAHPETVTSEGAEISMIQGTDDAGKLAEGEEGVSGLEMIDDYTVEVTTKEPVDINYFNEMVGNSILIAPQHVFSKIPNDEIQASKEAQNPTVTNGAYQFVEYQEENFLHLTANEDYYRGTPKTTEIFMRVLNDSALLTELQAGNIDMIAGGGIGDVPHDDIPLVQEVEHLEVEKHPSPNVQYLMINTENERFADPRVRVGIAHALNLDMIIENMLHGNGETLAAPYSSANDYKHKSLEAYPYDPEKARKILEDAGFDFSKPVELSVPTGNAIREQNGDLVEQWLEAVGIEVNQVQYDFTTWSSNFREGNYEVGLSGMGHSYDPDMQDFIGTGGSSNNMRYSDERMDELLVRGKAVTDFEERYSVYEEIQEYYKEEMPAIPLYSEYVYTIQDENLQGGIQGFWPASVSNLHEWEIAEE